MSRSDTVGVLIIYVLLIIAFAAIPLAGGYKAAYISLLLFNLATGFFPIGCRRVAIYFWVRESTVFTKSANRWCA